MQKVDFLLKLFEKEDPSEEYTIEEHISTTDKHGLARKRSRQILLLAALEKSYKSYYAVIHPCQRAPQ